MVKGKIANEIILKKEIRWGFLKINKAISSDKKNRSNEKNNERGKTILNPFK